MAKTKISNLEITLFPLLVGIIAGIFSLFISVALETSLSSSNGSFSPLSLLPAVVLEEVIKLFCLKYLFNLYFSTEKVYLISGLLGTGFGLFETVLVTINLGTFSPASIILVFVHTLASLLLATGLWYYQKRKNKLWIFFFCLLAIIFHLCYNLFVVNFD